MIQARMQRSQMAMGNGAAGDGSHIIGMLLSHPSPQRHLALEMGGRLSWIDGSQLALEHRHAPTHRIAFLQARQDLQTRLVVLLRLLRFALAACEITQSLVRDGLILPPLPLPCGRVFGEMVEHSLHLPIVGGSACKIVKRFIYDSHSLMRQREIVKAQHIVRLLGGS